MLNSTINSGAIVFGNPIVVENTVYTQSLTNDYCDFYQDIADLTRFAIEEIFRSHGFDRVRLDGVSATKDAQYGPEYEDYKYAEVSYDNHSVIICINDFINNNKMTAYPKSLRPLAMHPANFMWMQRDTSLYESLKYKYINDRSRVLAEKENFAKANTASTQTPDSIVYNAVNSPIENVKSTEVINDTTGSPEIAKANTVNPFVHMDRFAMSTDGKVIRDYKPIKGYFFKKYGDIITNLEKWVDETGLHISLVENKKTKLIDGHFFDSDMKQIPDISITIDLDGCIYGSIPKFWGCCRSTNNDIMLETLPYVVLEENTIKNYLRDPSGESWLVNTEYGQYMQRLNMTVELSTIKEPAKRDIMSLLLPRINELDNIRSNLNTRARFRFASANLEVPVIELYIGPSSTEYYGGPICGPVNSFKYIIKGSDSIIGENMMSANKVVETTAKVTE